jgi:hypothetical protein
MKCNYGSTQLWREGLKYIPGVYKSTVTPKLKLLADMNYLCTKLCPVAKHPVMKACREIQDKPPLIIALVDIDCLLQAPVSLQPCKSL